jgi:hypothetical protein
MNGVSRFIAAMKTAHHLRIATRDMVAVVSERPSGRNLRSFAHDFIALNDDLLSIGLIYNPFSSKEFDCNVGAVVDRDKVHESVGAIQGEVGAPAMINEAIETGSETGKFLRQGHDQSTHGGRGRRRNSD